MLPLLGRSLARSRALLDHKHSLDDFAQSEVPPPALQVDGRIMLELATHRHKATKLGFDTAAVRSHQALRCVMNLPEPCAYRVLKYDARMLTPGGERTCLL